jgi:NADPH:quinone reductase-like Zn-dependent oxidoreductase
VIKLENKMKAIIINKYGGPEVIEYTDVVTPKPEKNEVLVKVKAASVNPVDWKIRMGNLKFMTGKKFPVYLGTEVSGVVESIGEDVKNITPGQRVFAGLSYKGGGYAEFAKAPEENLVILPDNVSFEDACTFGVAGITPLQGLQDHGLLEEGMHVLVNGASGGTGTYAVQIAKILKARVTAVCSTKNIELVKSLGADSVIDYTKEDFTKNKAAYDIIIDCVGSKTFGQAKKALKKKGRYVNINPSPKLIIAQLFSSIFGGKKARLVMLKINREDLLWIRDQVALENIKVIIDRTFPVKEARKAHEYSETGRARGKIVLTAE